MLLTFLTDACNELNFHELIFSLMLVLIKIIKQMESFFMIRIVELYERDMLPPRVQQSVWQSEETCNKQGRGEMRRAR